MRTPEQIKQANNANMRRWYAQNKERRRKYQKDNRARYNLHSRNWRIRNRGSSKLTTSYRNSWRNRQKLKLSVSGEHSAEEWRQLKATHGYMCHGCSDIEPNITLSKDHIIPLSKGGTDDISNIQPLCIPCNSRKCNRIIVDLWER